MNLLILLLTTSVLAQGPLFHPVPPESLYVSEMLRLHNSASFNCVIAGVDSHALVKIRDLRPSTNTKAIVRTIWALAGSKKILYNITRDSGVIYADVLVDGVDLRRRLKEEEE